MDLVTPTIGFFAVIAAIVFFESKRRPPCSHLQTRCLHGDEITARIKVYSFRFWKQEVIRRQVCIDCGAALDRVAICTATGKDQHTWDGPWPKHFVVSEFNHEED